MFLIILGIGHAEIQIGDPKQFINAEQRCCGKLLFNECCVTLASAVNGTYFALFSMEKKVQAGKDQEKAQPEKDSHPKNQGGEKKLTIRYLYHENIS